MVKKLMFAATILFFSFTILSQSDIKSEFNGIKVSTHNQNEIVLQWHIENLQINSVTIENNTYQYIRFTGSSTTDQIDKPEIPFKEFRLGVPDNASLTYSLSNVIYETISNITPVPVGRPYRDKFGIESVKRVKDDKDYNFKPKEVIEFSPQFYFKQLPVVQTKFFPVTYDDQTKTVKYIKSAKIRISIKGGERNNTVSTSDAYLNDLYNQYVINYKQAKTWLKTKTRKLKKSTFVTQGPWYKIEVTEDGLYKILPSTLTSAGINISSIDPRTFQVFNNGGVPLNINAMASENNPEEPVENAIYVSGETDGSFDSGDYILFYGTQLGGWNYSTSKNDFVYTQHPYDTKNYYWLTFGNVNGKRMSLQQQPSANATMTESYFWRRVHFEEDTYNLLSSGSDWYGHKFFGTSDQNTFSYSLSGLSSTNNSAKFIVKFKGGSDLFYPYETKSYNYTFTTYINPSITTQHVSRTTFSDERSRTIEAQFNSNDYLVNGSNSIKIDYNGNYESCTAYLDYFEFYYPSDLSASNNYLEFYTNTLGQITTFNISNFNSTDVKLFDVSDPTEVKEVSTNGLQNGTLQFGLDLTDNIHHRFVATSLTSPSIKSVTAISEFSPSKDLFDPTLQSELIIITHPGYESYAEEIVNLRGKGHSPISGTVVNTKDIYFYFGSGVKDPTAIRNFIRHAYTNWTSTGPKYILLFGDGHYDYRNITISDTNFIPPYEINNNRDLESRETDNYYVDVNRNNTNLNYISPDLAVGRLPVESHLDARRVVDKLFAYENEKSRDGWQTVMTFVGDDTEPDGWDFQDSSESLATLNVLEKFLIRKIYLTAYNSIPGGFGRIKPEANQDIMDQINEGTLFINFVGHGSSQVWAHENVFDMGRDLNRIQNEGKLSIFIAATCTFGKFDNPLSPSFTEALIWRENSGAIGVIAASRGVYNGPNVTFNRNFYNALFPQGASSKRLGDALLMSVGTSSNYQKFHLFADPSMFPADPRNEIRITSIQPDTLKSLSKVNVSGQIYKDSTFWQDFNGGAAILVNDAIFEDVNTGGGGAHNYDLMGPRVFKGEISINNGTFSREAFIVPKSIRYQNRKTGRITIYAWDESDPSLGDAIGYVDTLLFYGTTNLTDDQGPEIDLYFDGQEYFNDGDLINANPTLIAEISDDNGINLTQEVGHVIEIKINNELSKDVTSFFSYDRDSYSNGKLTYHLEDLSSGNHELSVKAWDNLNNPSEKVINFKVVNSDGLVLENVINYPNPFNNDTYFTFQALGSLGSDVIVKIYTISGRLIKTIESGQVADGFNKIYWDGRDEDGDAIANGVYPYKLIIKNGNQSKEKIEKLVILR